MTPRRGKYYSLPFLPATPLSPSRIFKGLFELTTRQPSRALNSPCALHPELQRIKDKVRCATLGAEVQLGHRQEQLKQTLIVRFVEKRTSFHCSRNWAHLAPLLRPPCVNVTGVAVGKGSWSTLRITRCRTKTCISSGWRLQICSEQALLQQLTSGCSGSQGSG